MPITLEDIQAFIYKGEVANYSALPPAASVPNAFYWVKASQGTKFIGALWGGSYYPAGTYHSDGASWEYMGTPSQATQPIVDAGTDTERYITSKLFNDSAQLASKASLTGVETLTNKRINSRVTSIVSSAVPTINTDNCDAVDITALAAAITSMTTSLSGTPTNFQKLIIRIKDNGTARAIAWGASYASMGGTLPTTTVLGKVTTVGLIYNTTTSIWGCVAVSQEV